MCAHERERTLQQCRDKQIDVLFCTTAFGLGIDITVRTVLHWDVPQSLCQYVQEIGRAGRDDKRAMCKMFVAPNWYQKRCKDAYKNIGYGDMTVVKARELQKYITGDNCRHKFVLEYFTAPDIQLCGRSCDVCCARENQ
jgi:ATP-dependent DNA helicase RecQ